MDGRIAKIEKNVQTALPSDLQIGIMCDLLYLKIICLQYSYSQAFGLNIFSPTNCVIQELDLVTYTFQDIQHDLFYELI